MLETRYLRKLIKLKSNNNNINNNNNNSEVKLINESNELQDAIQISSINRLRCCCGNKNNKIKLIENNIFQCESCNLFAHISCCKAKINPVISNFKNICYICHLIEIEEIELNEINKIKNNKLIDNEIYHSPNKRKKIEVIEVSFIYILKLN
jgi:hypothetical protein